MKSENKEQHMALFSTKTHGVLDYTTVATLLVLPRALGWSPTVRTFVTGAALATLGASLLTRYELGLFKVIPMRGHLALDAISGATFAAAPFLFPNENASVTGTLVGLGVFELMAAFTTDTEPSLNEQASQLGDQLSAATRDVGDTIYDAVNNR